MASAPTLRAPSAASALGLVVANVVPLVGVLWFGWSLVGVMALYWAENGVIGVFALLRILGAREGGVGQKLFLGPFFAVHYGGFWLGHGVFLASLFGGDAGLADAATMRGIVEGLAALVLSHGASFAVHYVWGGEWTAANAHTEMFKPYGRVVLLHVVILLGGVAVATTGAGVAALALLVVLKTGLDLGVHVVGHRIRRSDLALAEPDPRATTIRLDHHPSLGGSGSR
ncbi:DUF6498-containing protein [Rubrivirga sp. IMCC45206]|uniref:DUF6498-containing protein n=1 Tax=Rubrivirga sp. IMCC45206 TaxID=3391614 RepID=UPI00398FE6AA